MYIFHFKVIMSCRTRKQCRVADKLLFNSFHKGYITGSEYNTLGHELDMLSIGFN
jgi:hypothetical protein